MKLCYILASIAASVVAAPINHYHPYDSHSQRPQHSQQRQYPQHQPAYWSPLDSPHHQPIAASVIAAPINHPHSQRPQHPQQRQYLQHQPAYWSPLDSPHHQPIAASVIAAPINHPHSQRPRNPPRQYAFPLAQHAGHISSGQAHELSLDPPHQQPIAAPVNRYHPYARHPQRPPPHDHAAQHQPAYIGQHKEQPPPYPGHLPPGQPESHYRPQHPQQQQHYGHTPPGQRHASPPQQRPLQELSHWEKALAELQPAYPLGQGDAGPSHLAALNPGQGHDPPAAPTDIEDALMKARYRAKHEGAAEAWHHSITANTIAINKLKEAFNQSSCVNDLALQLHIRHGALRKSWKKFKAHTTAAISETKPSGGVKRIDKSIQSGIAETIAANDVIGKVESGEWC